MAKIDNDFDILRDGDSATVSQRRITGLLPQNVAISDQLSYTRALNETPRLLKAGKSLPAYTARGIETDYSNSTEFAQVEISRAV